MSKLTFFFTLFGCLFIGYQVVIGGTDSEMRELLFAKLNSTDYSPRVRPIKDTGKVLNLYVDLYLVSINKVDEVSQKITSTAFMKIKWSDTFMTWEPPEFGNIAQFSIRQNDIWKPDLALANAYSSITGLGDRFMYVVVSNDGNITWEPYQVFESTCNLDMTYFPFDSHVCNLDMATWSSTKDMIEILPGDDGFNIDVFEDNANWNLENVTTFDSSTSLTSSMSFSFTIRRKPVYFIINVIIPIILLSVLNNFVFILPCDSGEKLSFAVILFLSFAIFLLIVTETMPEGMSTIPVVTKYLLVECLFSTNIVLTTAVQLRLHKKGDSTPVPDALKKFTKVIQYFTNMVCCSSQKTNGDDTDEEVIRFESEKIKPHNINRITETNRQTKRKFFGVPESKIIRRILCISSSDTNTACNEFPLDTWNDSNKRMSAKTDFRLADILGISNRVEPSAFFNKPPQVSMYEKDLAMEDMDDVDKMSPETEIEHSDLKESTKSKAFQNRVFEQAAESESETASVDTKTVEKEEITWPDFVLALDILFLIVSVIINTVATIVAFVVAYSG